MSASDYYDQAPREGGVSVCRRCGCVVGDTVTHDAWHAHHGDVPSPDEAAVVWRPSGPTGDVVNGDRMQVCDACGSKRCPRAGGVYVACAEHIGPCLCDGTGRMAAGQSCPGIRARTEG